MTTTVNASHVRRMRVFGQDVRVSVRPGTQPGPPLVLCNGIGASLDLLEPFVAALPEGIEVVHSDRDVGVFVVTGWGSGSGCAAAGDPPSHWRSGEQFRDLGWFQGVPSAVQRLECFFV